MPGPRDEVAAVDLRRQAESPVGHEFEHGADAGRHGRVLPGARLGRGCAAGEPGRSTKTSQSESFLLFCVVVGPGYVPGCHACRLPAWLGGRRRRTGTRSAFRHWAGYPWVRATD